MTGGRRRLRRAGGRRRRSRPADDGRPMAGGAGADGQAGGLYRHRRAEIGA
ncbi:hypothetical protein CLOSTASPAR_02213 [[Clostridium] asparagiforme DSM 15981]|uniref:Uncharacterized protein n=1 Tax=[Clostridium] asparagiforme DSM 15981 TaxID=518636 RepID=C0CYY6_9FIRM|nr:hypothetical protein CLOSTASPAR_02213 [[Clostridium] asparagiforme DSM 15981]